MNQDAFTQQVALPSKKFLRKQLLSMILPLITENILQLLASLVSMGMLGRISTVAVTSHGVSSLLTGIIWSFFKGITIGATVIIAKAHGAQDKPQIRKVAQQTIFVLVIISVILSIVVQLFPRQLLGVFNPAEIILKNASTYLRIIAFGFPFLAIMLCVTGFLQGQGNTKTPMKIAAIMNIANIIVSGTLIFGLFGIKPLGLTGAAIGLVVAQIVGALCGLWCLFSARGVLYRAFARGNFKIEPEIIKEVFRIGIPSGLENIFWQAASIALSRIILSFGDVAFAANQLGLQAESISEMPALGFGIAATTFTGQALGAQNKQLGKAYISEIRKGAMLIISVGSMILLLFPRQVMGILTNDAEVIALGAIYLRLMALIQIPQNLQRVYTGALKGAGHTRIPMLISGIGLWGVRVPLAFILTKFFHVDIVGIWVVVCIDQIVRFILSYIFYKRKNIWKERAEPDKSD